MPGQSAMAGALRKAGRKAARVVTPENQMSKLDEFLQSIGDPNAITDDQLRQWEAMIPSLNAVDRSRGSRFLGLAPDSKFPNQRILSRAGIGDKFTEAMETPLWQADPSTSKVVGKAPEFSDADILNGLSGQGLPGAARDEMADVFGSQMAGMPTPKRTGKIVNPRNAAILGGSALMGGLVGAGLRNRGGGMPEVGMTEPKMGRSNTVGMSEPKMGRSSLPSPRAGGLRRPQPKQSLGLSGINGAGDMSDLSSMQFAPSVNFEEMFKQADTEQTAEMQPQQKGGGFMDFMKTIGPLIAALMAGRMMR